MTKLQYQQCGPCTGETEPLSAQRIERYLQQVPGWVLDDQQQRIQRSFEFSGFLAALSFVNALAWIAHHQGHHPDFSVAEKTCMVKFTTHAINGLSENDFICASRVNALLEN